MQSSNYSKYFDEYDELIQFVDSIAGTEGVMDIIDRMDDVKSRYGSYNPGMRENNLRLKDFYEQKMGMDLYVAVDKDNYRPWVVHKNKNP